VREDSSILRACRIDGLSISHNTSDPNLFKMTFSSCKYYSAHQLMNFGKGKTTSTAKGVMDSWAASRKGICFPTLSSRLELDTKMGETVFMCQINQNPCQLGLLL
jgi:hypothetical protein